MVTVGFAVEPVEPVELSVEPEPDELLVLLVEPVDVLPLLPPVAPTVFVAATALA